MKKRSISSKIPEDAVAAYVAAYDETYPHYKPHSFGNFKREYWTTFDVRAAFCLIVGEQSFPGHKKVVLAGLCAWLANSSDVKFRQAAMVHAVIEELAAAESVAKKKLSRVSFGGDLIARQVLLGPYFFSEIYYPIGGVAKLAATRPRLGLDRSWRKIAEEIRACINIVRLLSAAQTHLSELTSKIGLAINGLTGHASFVFREMKGRTELSRYWRQHRRNIAIYYAASKISVSSDKTLLDILLSRNPDPEILILYFQELVGKTAYVVDFILSKISTGTGDSILNDLYNATPHIIVPIKIDTDLSASELQRFREALTAHHNSMTKSR